MTQNELTNLLEEQIKITYECEWIEFKENNSDIEMIGKYLSALSNAACYRNKDFGYLIYGVKDNDHTIVGTTFNPLKAKKGNEEIKHWLLQRLSPKIDFQIYFFQYQNKDIAIFTIPATINTPVRFSHTAYIRIGSITRELKEFPEIERKIWDNSENTEFEKGIAISNISTDKLFELLDYAKYYELLKLPQPFDKEIIIQKMEEENFIIKKLQSFDVTNLGAILFARELDKFEKLSRKAIRIILYKGKNRLTTIKEHPSNKGYAIDFAAIIDYIDDQLPTNEEIGKAFREQIKVYPKLAIRELVANAIIHQDFHVSGTSVSIEIFDDRIEISNPGKPLIETQRFIDHKPQSRNEKLAYFMRRINICEERGSGIDKVINECEIHQLPAPNFLDNGNYTNVILYAPKTLRQLDLTDKIRACYQHCSLKYVSGEFMTNQSLRERFAIDEKNYSTVSRIIGATKSENLIKEYNPENKANKYTKYLPYWA